MVDRRPSNSEIDEAKVLPSPHSKSPKFDSPNFEERFSPEVSDIPIESSDEDYIKDFPVEDYREDSPAEVYCKGLLVEENREDSPAEEYRKNYLAEENRKHRNEYIDDPDSETESKCLVEAQTSEKIEIESSTTESHFLKEEETKSTAINTSDTDAFERNELTTDSNISLLAEDMPLERPGRDITSHFNDPNDHVYPNTPVHKETWKSSSPRLPPHLYNNVNQLKSSIYREEDYLPHSDFGLPSKHHEPKNVYEDNPHYRQVFEETKKNYLAFIHNYEKGFKFKESNSDVQTQMSELNREFCDKCEQLTSNCKTNIKNEDKEKLKMMEEIQQFEQSTKESEETCLELEEALKKANSELNLNSDSVYSCYVELRSQVSNYLYNQKCHSSKRVDIMIQILLNNIINCRPYQPLIEIESLFTDSQHEDWIPHTRDQIISSLLLKQDETQVSSQLIIKIFEEVTNISVKSDESLEIAIMNAYTLSKYAIAKDIYFNGDLSFEGLSLLKKKENVIIEETKPIIKPINIQQESTPPPPLPDRHLQITQEIENFTRFSANTMKDLRTANEIYIQSVTMGKNYTPPSNRQEIYHISEMPYERWINNWRIHMSSDPSKKCSDPSKKCLWCQVYKNHRSDEIFNPKKSPCSEPFLCEICTTVKAHETCLKNNFSIPFFSQSIKPKCEWCQRLNPEEKKTEKKADKKADKKAEKKEKKNERKSKTPRPLLK